ncbi:hypothetical protein V7138_08925 [Bacillus sp. JJ1533]|uniref:hypothetical protein n=1 Tax=Bacillus sp. JJ1533 TaxID=3122959 RepID=UPI002FFD9BA0
MKKQSNNPVFLQQKIIHLQSELAKYKSVSNLGAIVSENQQLKYEINQILDEKKSLNEQIKNLQSQLEEFRDRNSNSKRRNNQENQVNARDTESNYSENWFLNSLRNQNAVKNR